ncbi:MAG: FliA/WhiG family RNA polymerase sigma factor [Bacillota bacterium]|nr:FliA/WhiG family RNA polymerase sigma factor [Bacillota bacterium]
MVYVNELKELKEQKIQELWERFAATREIRVRNLLVEQYRGLVKCLALKTVGRYQYFNYMEDLVSEGVLALIDAIEKFDVNRNIKFETYGSIKIRGAMIDYIRRQDCFPRRLKNAAKHINEAENELANRLGRLPSDQEIADFMGVKLSEFEKMLGETCVLNMVSFEKLIYEQDMEKVSMQDQPDMIPGPEQEVIEQELHGALTNALSGSVLKLNPQENAVISFYYKEKLKIKEIAEIMGISDPRVSQIHSNALRKLKFYLEDYLNQ